eukprot:scaffold148_cov243-Pinguiococcus_pyrenoidosus.AAC.10
MLLKLRYGAEALEPSACCRLESAFPAHFQRLRVADPCHSRAPRTSRSSATARCIQPGLLSYACAPEGRGISQHSFCREVHLRRRSHRTMNETSPERDLSRNAFGMLDEDDDATTRRNGVSSGTTATSGGAPCLSHSAKSGSEASKTARNVRPTGRGGDGGRQKGERRWGATRMRRSPEAVQSLNSPVPIFAPIFPPQVRRSTAMRPERP